MNNFLSLVLSLILAVACTRIEAFHVVQPSHGPSRSKSTASTAPQSSTLISKPLFYASGVTEKTQITIHQKQRTASKKALVDPLSSIANLYDPQLRIKARCRLRKIANVDRETFLKKQKTLKANAKSNFEQGQEAAKQAIQEILQMYNIKDAALQR